MKKILYFVFVIQCFSLKAQDTTWVQTFTFDSIATRRANFDFPTDLNTKRFEKVLMYYKLICSPLTPWDNYNCGEWDYLTYSRIFEHTGVFDSTLVNGSMYHANTLSPTSIVYDNLPLTHSDTYVREEKNRSGATLNYFAINSGTTTTNYPFDLSKNGGRFQYLITASELIASGITPGNIESLRLFINSFSINGELKYPRISIKSSALTSLTQFEKTGFTEVYNASHWANGSQAELLNGQNDLLFYQAFSWNGTDNIIIEFYYENSQDASNSLLFDAEDIVNPTALGYADQNGAMAFSGSNWSMSELSDFTMGNEMTIAFWAKGTGSTGTNTSILEAYDSLNQRIVNIHMPWSDNNMYFDAGVGSGYDRISKAMTGVEIDNNWNHWAFVKNATSGDMKIYKNGVLWHSGTGKTIPVGYIHRLVIGSNLDHNYWWKGKIDEFQIYNSALSQTDIQNWMTKKINNTHPKWSNLLVYYDFDNKKWAEDLSDNDNLLMPSQFNSFDFSEFPNVSVEQQLKRPLMSFGQGIVSGSMQVTQHPKLEVKEPTVVFEYTSVNRHFEIANAFVGQLSGNETTYDLSNAVVSQVPFTGSNSLTNDTISYYRLPVERVNDIEIGRYITPYGIGFDLGPNGFTYIYDVTDYQHYLKNTVDLAAHNTQELIDVRFAFIEGIPPRDVHNRQPIWSEFRSYQYADMDNNVVLPSVSIPLADSSSMFKIKTRFTGHGHNGTTNCCEWDPKDHQISIDGVPRFNWEIWQETECGDNPNVAQGGTWPYAREGWCPGDMVKEYDHELTPYVTPGQAVSIDYDIENVPVADAAQGNGNYVVAMDLISYSAPNFQHDASIVDILNPNNYEYYKKFNPTCSDPRVIIQNTGEQVLSSCVIRIYINPTQVIDYNWSGNLAFLEKEIVQIPVSDVTWWQSFQPGTQTFHAEILSVGGVADEYEFNNKKTTLFAAPEIIDGPFYVRFTTNNKAIENKYRIEDSNGDIVFERTNMTNSTLYRDTFDLSPGCYSMILEDSDHDGIAFWASANYEGETSGNFYVRKVGGTTIEQFPGDFGHYHRYNFTIGLEQVGIKESTESNELVVYPNPTSGVFQIDFNGSINSNSLLLVRDISGKVVLTREISSSSDLSEVTVDLTMNPSGIYFIEVQTEKGVFKERIVKK